MGACAAVADDAVSAIGRCVRAVRRSRARKCAPAARHLCSQQPRRSGNLHRHHRAIPAMQNSPEDLCTICADGGPPSPARKLRLVDPNNRSWPVAPPAPDASAVASLYPAESGLPHLACPAATRLPRELSVVVVLHPGFPEAAEDALVERLRHWSFADKVLDVRLKWGHSKTRRVWASNRLMRTHLRAV